MYKVLKDNETEIFLDAIPRWITHFGFGLSVLIFIGLVITTSMISYPRKVGLQVSMTNEKNIAITDFSTFGLISDHQEITIQSPFGNQIKGVINKSEAWAEQNSIYMPIHIDEGQKQRVKFKNEITCPAEILLDNLTLLEKLME